MHIKPPTSQINVEFSCDAREAGEIAADAARVFHSVNSDTFSEPFKKLLEVLSMLGD
ncbi:hypothetical protein [Streptomyces griseosporeus]|uniref:hypothetical protein n=1 Tax=Streptomyces griseosporeus TaxID=1910 RepID=UPI00167E5581|nr:hypothetical protein [Streptomyces griseosporeus]GHF92360.1 hypothetical protein GCM10018783_74070 [Streptomyces griseosporeus]